MIAVIELTLTNYSAALRLDGFLKLICSPEPVAQAITFRAFGALLDALPNRAHPSRAARLGTPGSGYCPARDSLGNRRLRRALYHGLRGRAINFAAESAKRTIDNSP